MSALGFFGVVVAVVAGLILFVALPVLAIVKALPEARRMTRPPPKSNRAQELFDRSPGAFFGVPPDHTNPPNDPHCVKPRDPDPPDAA